MIYKVRENSAVQQYFENGEWITCKSSVFLSYYHQWLMNGFKSKEQVKEDGYTVFETELPMEPNKPYPSWMNY